MQISLAMTLSQAEGYEFEANEVNDMAKVVDITYSKYSDGDKIASDLMQGKWPEKNILLRGEGIIDQNFATNGFCSRMLPELCGKIRPDAIKIDGPNKKIEIIDMKLSGSTRESQDEVLQKLAEKLSKTIGSDVKIDIRCQKVCSYSEEAINGIKRVVTPVAPRGPPLSTEIGKKIETKYNPTPSTSIPSEKYSSKNSAVEEKIVEPKPTKSVGKIIGTAGEVAFYVCSPKDISEIYFDEVNKKALYDCMLDAPEIKIKINDQFVNNIRVHVGVSKQINPLSLCGCKKDESKALCCTAIIGEYYNINLMIKNGKLCTGDEQRIDNIEQDVNIQNEVTGAVSSLCENFIDKPTSWAVNEILKNIPKDNPVRHLLQAVLKLPGDIIKVGVTNVYDNSNNNGAYKGCHKGRAPMNWCSPDCKCNIEEGDCDIDTDCISGICDRDSDFFIDSVMDYCREKPSLKEPENCHIGRTTLNYCTPDCLCNTGEGPCNKDNGCVTGYCKSGGWFEIKRCAEKPVVSNKIETQPAPLSTPQVTPQPTQVIQVVSPPINTQPAQTAPNCHVGRGVWNYCSPDCPCNIGEGDCDTDADCMVLAYCQKAGFLQVDRCTMRQNMVWVRQ